MASFCKLIHHSAGSMFLSSIMTLQWSALYHLKSIWSQCWDWLNFLGLFEVKMRFWHRWGLDVCEAFCQLINFCCFSLFHWPLSHIHNLCIPRCLYLEEEKFSIKSWELNQNKVISSVFSWKTRSINNCRRKVTYTHICVCNMCFIMWFTLYLAIN